MPPARLYQPPYPPLDNVPTSSSLRAPLSGDARSSPLTLETDLDRRPFLSAATFTSTSTFQCYVIYLT
jgi:hypothetical protein